MGFFDKLKSGLKKTKESFMGKVDSILAGFGKVDEDLFDELEDILISSDFGVQTTEVILENLRRRVKEQKTTDPGMVRLFLQEEIAGLLTVGRQGLDVEDTPAVITVIGVNGVGKTTSIGKMAHLYRSAGKKVLLAAGDTFRAAAIDQLKTWANRAGVDIIAQNEGADPSAVVYDAVAAAKSRNTDILLIDTAGRLHNKKNLMDELAKMRRIITREYPEANVESLIVLDGTTGQNALEQARQFSSVTEINGIIITKLDGTAKGGIAIAIQSELNVPVKYIGIGEQIDDLQKFDPNSYVNALFADFDIRSDVEILVDENIENIPKDDDLFDMN